MLAIKSLQPPAERGFALVVTLMLMVLITLIAVGMLGLAAIELRRGGGTSNSTIAKANARLALMQAIGQLQRTLGPDQRVSASAEILPGTPKQPLWTGVWKTTNPDGSSVFSRNDLDGGLRDSRETSGSTPAARVIEWLVSGSANPISGPSGRTVELGRDDSDQPIQVSKVPMLSANGALTGHHAWWTGDLGVRINLGTRDPWKLNISPFSSMISQSADASIMNGGKAFSDTEAARLVSAQTTGLTAVGKDWAQNNAFNLTVDSQGILVDTIRGGLKQDLTAFINGSSTIAPLNDLPGISDNDPIINKEVADQNQSRIARISPTFGVLRDWARINAPDSGRNVSSTMSDFDPVVGKLSARFALANETPVKLAGNTRASLQPILVEATIYNHLSTFRLESANPPKFQLRSHLYPRVVLWNPYNIELNFDRSMIMIQGNGRQEMWTENFNYNWDGSLSMFSSISQWLSFEGGRSTSFNDAGKGIMATEGYNDSYIGSYFFSIPQTRFAPGECLVFSPAVQAEYDCLSPYRLGSYNLNANVLSSAVAPDPSRSYNISGTDIGGGMSFRPFRFWYAPTPYWSQSGRNGVENQGDDTRAILKHVGSSASSITFEDFDRLPQIAVLSASLQYGAGREPRIAWANSQKMPMELLSQKKPRPTIIPDVRTREGVRLRWFDEHRSNVINSGPLRNTPFMEEALLANWNPRAAFAVRSPWENIGGELPVSGTLGGPWFFGAFTRDLYDQEVSWQEQVPVFSDGRARGNPFGPPQEGAGRHILFEVPRSTTGVISIAQFQHAKISDLVWHPSYAIGNSLADPRIGTAGNNGLDRSAALSQSTSASKVGGFHPDQIGWSSDAERSKSKEEWSVIAKALLGTTPETGNLVFDLSFEVNHALWDRFFLSTGSDADKIAFSKNPVADPLPNGRIRLAPGGNPATIGDDLTNYHKAASRIMVDGAFNVNSTRVEAWKALLASGRLTTPSGDSNVSFPRIIDAPGGAWKTGSNPDSDEIWTCRRELTPEEIDRFARAIVEEVKLRGPLISLADFVNRRLARDDTGRLGALQAAIEKTNLNATLISASPIDNSSPLPNYRHPDNIGDSTSLEQTLKPASKVWGAPAWLTQADVLQIIGPVLSARSDTFVIRAYGEAIDAAGKTTATAWCEAVVQRTPEPLDPDANGINPRKPGAVTDFGRRFLIKSFRWLSPSEV